MNNEIQRNIIRFILLALLQVVIFMNMLPNWKYVHIFIYPLIIILASFKYSNSILLLIAFSMGLFIDFFSDTPGLNSGALVLMAFTRPLIMTLFEPTGGYLLNKIPSIANYSFVWFMKYASVLMLIHLVVYFSLESFSFVFFWIIVEKTIVSFIASMIFILIYQFIFVPKD